MPFLYPEKATVTVCFASAAGSCYNDRESHSEEAQLGEETGVNIQIFGTKKCFDTKKAERYFKERRVKYQMIDLREKGMSRGELQSVVQAVKGLDNLLDPDAKDTQTLALVKYLTNDAKLDKVFENQQLIKTPVVRNGKQATTGYRPDVWKTWE